MAKSVFQKKYTNRLLNKLQKERRKSLERKKGQVIILADTKELQEAIYQVYPGLKVKKAILNRALKVGREKARGLQKNVPARKFNAINTKLPEVLPRNKFRLNTNVFILSNFATAKIVKDAMIQSLIEQKALTKEQADKVTPKLHRGHGVQGDAVSQVEIASTASGMTEQDLDILKAGINRFAEIGEITYVEALEINKLLTRHEMIVTKAGGLKATYFSILNFQHEKGNLEDKNDEKALKQAYRKFLNEVTPELLNMEGSSSMKQKATHYLGETMERYLKSNPNVRVRYKKVDLKTGSVTERKNKTDKPKLRIRTDGKTSVRMSRKGIASSPLQLFLAMNAQLPDTIAKNMQSPRLNYRTGRFANSVKITDVIMTPQGFPSVGYTYQKNPYQTFEPGFAQGDPDRDPRRLIDMSIRELAVKFAIGRFYTRRV